MESYWIETGKKQKRDFEKLKQNKKVDVCIIGGGLTGITTAYYLNKKGFKVVVLERDRIGEKTSGRSTGKVTSQHGLFYDYLIQSEGVEFAKKYKEANEEAIDNIEKIVGEEGINCDFERQDSYVFTEKVAEVEKIKKEVEAVKSLGFTCEFATNIPLNKNCLASIKFPNQAQYNPYLYLVGLTNCFVKNGGEVYEDTKVMDLKKENDEYIIYTEEQEVKSRYVVIASHYPIINSPGFYFLKMYQSMSYMIAIETSESIPDGMYINSELPTFSFRKVRDGDKNIALIAGSDHKTGAKIDLEDAYKNLEIVARQMYPDAIIRYKWNAEDCIPLDKIPYIGEFSSLMKNVYVGTGYKKWGLTSSNIAAKIITDEILGIDNKYKDLFKATRVEPIKNVKEVENMLKETTYSLVINKLKIMPKQWEGLEEEQGKIIEIDKQKVGVYKDKQGKIYAIRPICSHLGCELSWNNLAKTWDCPCHGSRFDYKGRSIADPSIKDLEKIEINLK